MSFDNYFASFAERYPDFKLGHDFKKFIWERYSNSLNVESSNDMNLVEKLFVAFNAGVKSGRAYTELG